MHLKLWEKLGLSSTTPEVSQAVNMDGFNIARVDIALRLCSQEPAFEVRLSIVPRQVIWQSP